MKLVSAKPGYAGHSIQHELPQSLPTWRALLMERSSGYTRILMRTCLLAVAGAAASVMGGLPVSAADEVNQERLLNVDKEPGNWLHHHQNYSAHRFSTLKEVNRDNVKNLKVAWTMHLGGIEGGGIWSHGGLEGTPIAENGFLYVTDG